MTWFKKDGEVKWTDGGSTKIVAAARKAANVSAEPVRGGRNSMRSVHGQSFSTRTGDEDDYDNFERGFDRATGTPQQILAASLFDPSLEPTVLVDSQGNIQGQYSGTDITVQGVSALTDIPMADIQKKTRLYKDGYLLNTLSTAPSNLGGEHKGWGVSTLYAAAREAQAIDAGFFVLDAAEGAEQFYESAGFKSLYEGSNWYIATRLDLAHFVSEYDVISKRGR